MSFNTAEITAQDKLSFNNSAVSDREDRIISFLEWWNWDIRIRYRINEYLQRTNPNIRASEINRRVSLKDKIAYVSSVTWCTVHSIVNWIESEILNSSDFSESSILRNAALNVFECRLSSEQKFSLSRCINNLKNFCISRQLTDIANSLDFHDESDAQKIEKMKEIVYILQKKGVDMKKFSEEWFNALTQTLKPLENLDASYKTMMVSISQVQEIAWHNFNDTSSITRNQIDKLNCVLREIKIKPEEIVNNFFKAEDWENRQYLQLKLDDIWLINQDFLVKNKISQTEFEKYFLVYFSREILEQAKLRFDKQKLNTFRHRSKLFDQEVNEWRWKARDRIMELWNNNTWESNEMLDSYFEKFQSVFYWDRDSVGMMWRMYRTAVDSITWYEQPDETNEMRWVLRWILWRRYWDLNGHNRWLTSIWTRWDLDRITDVIMNNNWTINQMFYSDTNPFVNEEWFWQRLSKVIWRTEVYRSQIKDSAMPTVNTILRWSEEVIKWVLAGAAWTWKLATRVISTPTAAFNSFIEKKAEWGFVKKNLIRVAKISWVFWPITKLIEKWATLTHTWIEKTEWVTENLYKKSIDIIRNTAWDKDINYMFQWFTHWLDWVLWLAWKSTSWAWNKAYDQLNTRQKREILARVYEAAWSEEELSRWMATWDLGNKIDIRNFWIHIFNEDWREDNLYSNIEKNLLWDEYESMQWVKDKKKQKAEELKAEEEKIKSEEDAAKSKLEKEAELLKTKKAEEEKRVDDINSLLSWHDDSNWFIEKSIDSKKKNSLKDVLIRKINKWSQFVIEDTSWNKVAIVIKKAPKDISEELEVDLNFLNLSDSTRQVKLDQKIKIWDNKIIFSDWLMPDFTASKIYSK